MKVMVLEVDMKRNSERKSVHPPLKFMGKLFNDL